MSNPVKQVLRRQRPERFVYAPNLWQWFAHQRNHGLLPDEIARCATQADVIRHLGLDFFSRNVYCDQRTCWYGGLAEIHWDGIEYLERAAWEGPDRVFTRTYRTRRGDLTETLRYVHEQSTLVQEKYLVDDYRSQLDALAELLAARRLTFATARYRRELARLPPGAVICAGELCSPLKMMHLVMNPVETVYCLLDQPERSAELMQLHQQSQLELARQIAAAGVPAVMSMDNLDTMFHPPHYVEAHAASFYERASRVCHEHGSTFFIHACGNQRGNLPLIASLGVDGLEGVAFPPLGDVELDEAMRLSGDRFLITGGIMATQFEQFDTRQKVFAYVRALLDRSCWTGCGRMRTGSCSPPAAIRRSRRPGRRSATCATRGTSTGTCDDAAGTRSLSPR